jgi:hypothetical protein
VDITPTQATVAWANETLRLPSQKNLTHAFTQAPPH